MKVGFDARCHARCGIQTYASNLVPTLENLYPQNSYRLIDYSQKSEWNPGVKHYINGLKRLYWENVALPIDLRQGNYDVVHNLRNGGIPQWAHCPVIVTVHDVIPWMMPSVYLKTALQRSVYHYMLQRVAARADAIITDSQFSADDLCKVLPGVKGKLSVIYLAADPDFYPRSGARRFFDFPYILTLGGSEPRKNVERLIQAYLMLPNRIQCQYKLVVVGGDWKGRHLRDIYSKEKCHGVIFIGTPSAEDLPVIYSQADLCVCPSLYEGFGLPVLEAMQCGTPVACSDNGCFREIAGEAAAFFDPFSREAMADSILKILDNPGLREELSCKGYEHAKKFRWEIAATETQEVYAQVLDAQR